MSKSYREVKRVGKKRRKKGPAVIVVAIIIIVALVAGLLFVKNQDSTSGDMQGGGVASREKVRAGYAISSSSKEAVLAAEKVLKEGGNAVDAAVALAYTLAVVEPYASGLGGGGCMVIYDPETENYYYYNYGSESSSSGYKGTVLIPGFVSGMEAVLEDFGTVELEQLLQPAMEYCDKLEINRSLAIQISNASSSLGEESVFFQDGEWLEEGDILTQPELKATLELIASEGSDVFYKGKIAEDITAATGLSMEDLAGYATIVSQPVAGEYNGYEVVAAGMPYSGTTLIQMLKMSEVLDMPDPKEDNQGFVDTLQEITVLSHGERAKTVYDYDAAGENIDIAQLVSDEHIHTLLGTDMSDYQLEEESEDTTAFTIIDENGMIVSCTNTLSSFFGCKKTVDGFYLNNTSRNFGTGVNAYEPGKRPRSHIAPAILRSEDEVIAIASPGGDAILKILATVIVDICQFGTEPQEAVDKQRLLFKTNYTISYEIGYETPAIADAYGTGYEVIPSSTHSSFGNVALSGYDSEKGFYAATDVRRDGYSCYNNR